MKTAFVALVLLLPAVLAVNDSSTSSGCQQYVTQAERYVAPPYPDYFGSGTEYFRAAECFSKEANIQTASQYYLLAADRFVTAANELVGGGDFRLRGRAFESAGDAYLRVDDKSQALDLYYKARNEFQNANLQTELAGVDAKIGSLTSNSQSTNNVPFLIGMGVLVAFFVLILILSSRKRSTPVERDLLDESTGRRSTTVPALAEKVTSTTLSALSGKNARERAADKLRQRYAPKR